MENHKEFFMFGGDFVFVFLCLGFKFWNEWDENITIEIIKLAPALQRRRVKIVKELTFSENVYVYTSLRVAKST